MSVTHEIEIVAPIDRVWSVTIDVEKWPTITPTTMTSVVVTSAPPFGIGSTARVKQPLQTAKVWRVTVCDEPRRFEWQTTALGITLRATHELTDLGDRTVNRLTIEASGRGAGLFERLTRRKMAATIATENTCFKRHIEAAA